MKNSPFFYASILYFLLYSCANPSSPTGGQKDDKKPKLSKTFPKNGSTHFRGKIVAFTFDEWVDENNLKDQVLITPKIETYKHSVNKNTLTLTFDSGAFKPNTTYYINLREGLKDITEGNKTDSTTLVFSTGKYLDSLSYSGKVYYLLENKSDKNISVALYELSDTFHIETASPLYLTKTDDAGKFTFSYLKQGTYLVYAFQDENKNGTYTPNKEPIAYRAQPLSISSSISSETLGLVKEDHEKPKIKRIESNKKKLTKIVYQKPIKTLYIKQIHTYDMNICSMLKQDEVSIFTSSPAKDSVQFILEASDIALNTKLDTVKLTSQFIDTVQYKVNCTPPKNSQIEPTEPIQINLSKPYAKFSNNLELHIGAKRYKGTELHQVVDIKEIPYQATIQLIPKTEWKDTVKLFVLPSCFTPISGYIKDTLKTKYSLKSLEKYGSIGGQVESSISNFIIQLLSKDGKVLKEVYNKKDFLFEYLNDGEYKLRVIEDTNQNLIWDQGDFRTRKMPENIHHYPDVIKLKSSWEILDVKIRF